MLDARNSESSNIESTGVGSRRTCLRYCCDRVDVVVEDKPMVEDSQARKSSDVLEVHLACGRRDAMENSFADGRESTAKPAEHGDFPQSRGSGHSVVATPDFM